MAVTEETERTTALGLFNTARSYWQSGVNLDALALKTITHPRLPVTFLLCHAIELYLKAFLRGAGHDLVQLKRIGHRVNDLARAAIAAGLALSPEDSAVLSHIEDDDIAIESRYIVTGFKSAPTNVALAECAGRLDILVSEALGSRGIPARRLSFEAPVPSTGELEPDTIRVLVFMFKVSNYEHRGTEVMARALQLEPSMLQYRLDILSEAGLADLGSIDDTQSYWSLTAKGRKYLVDRKLV